MAKTTLETSGEDVKTTLETSGEDVKTTLETSGEDVKIHDLRFGSMESAMASARESGKPIMTFISQYWLLASIRLSVSIAS